MLLENYIPSHRSEGEYGDYYGLSEKGTNYDMEDGVFVNGYDTVAEEDYYKHFFVDDWEWENWDTVGGID